MDRQHLISLSKEKPLLPSSVTALDIIKKTRDTIALSQEEIIGFINAITNKSIPDYQVSSWCMAVLLNGLTNEEATNLTLAMAASGKILDLSRFGVVADKHSSGGVGDKTTLVVAPLVASCGIMVGKMTGRGLGHTGGTVDKLESIPGLNLTLSTETFLSFLEKTGLVLAAQSNDLAPADGIIYGLRDVTGTTDSLPLIAASIMSKKIAAGPNTLLLDVKVGKGAFMKTIPQARELAALMVEIAKNLGITTSAEISDMNQPLGQAVGNSLEVIEAINTLKGKGPKDFTTHCIDTAAHILVLAKRQETFEKAKEMVMTQLSNGQALEKFRLFIQTQGGDPRVIDTPETILPHAKLTHTILATTLGYIHDVDPLAIGMAVVKLGGGRLTKKDIIDHSVGIMVHAKVGDSITKGQPLVTLYANDQTKLEQAQHSLKNAITITDTAISPLPLVYETIK